MPRIADLDYGNVECPVCLGEGWVCENHPDKAWDGGEGLLWWGGNAVPMQSALLGSGPRGGCATAAK